MSEMGIDSNTPFNPKNFGKIRANPTPNITSRMVDSMVEATAFPMDCRKIKHDLLIQAKTTIHKYIRKDFIANCV